MQPASFTLAVAACTHQLARACVMPRSAAVASRSGGFVSCSTLAVAGCRRQIASTCVMLHVAAVTHAHALKLSSPSWLHTCSRSMQEQIARARMMPRFAAVASLAGALVSCSTRHACSRCVQAADCFHVRELHVVLLAHTLVPSSRACSQPASHWQSQRAPADRASLRVLGATPCCCGFARSCLLQLQCADSRSLSSCFGLVRAASRPHCCGRGVCAAGRSRVCHTCSRGVQAGDRFRVRGATPCFCGFGSLVPWARACGRPAAYWRGLQAADRSHALACA
jgi:hypothetical protein